MHKSKAVCWLRFSICMSLLSLLTLLIFPSPPAFASGGKQPGHQPGTFIHLASTARPAGVAPGCAGTRCNNTNPYTEKCAGQAWDSWWVISSNPVIDNTTGATRGYIQLWWSQTCETNWGRLVPQTPYDWVNIWTGLSNGEQTPVDSNDSPISGQLYAPVLFACTEGDFRSTDGDIVSGASGQFRSDWETC